MRLKLTVAGVLLGCVVAVPSAMAATQTASAGNVTATFSFKGDYLNYKDEVLEIAQGATVVYDKPVSSTFCGRYCAPGSTSAKQPSVHVLDLEDNGLEDVVLDLYSGGAHCCFIEQIFYFHPYTNSYSVAQHDFGDPGERIVDLARNGHFEFLTADDSFAYRFTDFADSGLPIEILSFAAGHFTNVTRSYPQLIAKDAKLWLQAYKSSASDHWQDSVGLIAAWAADEDNLGHSKAVSRYLTQQANAGHLNSALSPFEPSGKKFVAALQKFLRARGYLR